ncbi:MAG: putative molybdenum carrier protein [Nitrospira sp.]|nr:putative molybdenum carrier protein [Nitrospira sp.]
MQCSNIAGSASFVINGYRDAQVTALRDTLREAAKHGFDWQELYTNVYEQWHTRRSHFPTPEAMVALMEQVEEQVSEQHSPAKVDEPMGWKVEKILSGGQTGADRAALDWAIAHQIPHGGWCPKGRRAEDGMIAAEYSLQETPQRNYRQRTKWNVRDSDATLIITLTKKLTGGSLVTSHQAMKRGRPWLHVCPNEDWENKLTEFVNQHQIHILNVAGPRSSSAPGIEAFVQAVLTFSCQPTCMISVARDEQALDEATRFIPDQRL